MNIDIIIVNSTVASNSATAQYVYLKGEDWVYICDKCKTWEVFRLDIDIEKLICWCCSGPYTKYHPSYSNES